MPQLSNTNRVQHNLEQHLSKLNTDRKAHNWGCLYSLPTQNLQAFAGNTNRYSLTSVYEGTSLSSSQQTSCSTADNQHISHFQVGMVKALISRCVSLPWCIELTAVTSWCLQLSSFLVPVQGLHAISQLATYKAPVSAPSHAAAPSGRGLGLLVFYYDTVMKRPVLYMETLAARCGYTVICCSLLLILLHAGIAARGQSGQLASRDRSVLL